MNYGQDFGEMFMCVLSIYINGWLGELFVHLVIISYLSLSFSRVSLYVSRYVSISFLHTALKLFHFYFCLFGSEVGHFLFPGSTTMYT